MHVSQAGIYITKHSPGLIRKYRLRAQGDGEECQDEGIASYSEVSECTNGASSLGRACGVTAQVRTSTNAPSMLSERRWTNIQTLHVNYFIPSTYSHYPISYAHAQPHIFRYPPPQEPPKRRHYHYLKNHAAATKRPLEPM
jgi:hypothetical protein